MRGGGPDGAPVVSSGMAARGRNHDRAGGRDGAVVRGRIESREDLDRQDVDGGDLLEHLQVLKQVAAVNILTIEILTGLDATTHYGAISTSGAIVITTTSGHP